MKKVLLVALICANIGLGVAWANEGAPMPICQPGHCGDHCWNNVVATANLVRSIEGKTQLTPPCLVQNK